MPQLHLRLYRAAISENIVITKPRMDDRDEHIKTVYAHFGLAMYLAQVLEHGLVSALVFLELLPMRAGDPLPRKAWEAEFDTFMERNFQATLGRMIKNLKAAAAVPCDLEALLADALGKRNFLAHSYFRDHADDLMSFVGRNKMIEELEIAQTLFIRADELLSATTKVARERYGITDEKTEEWFARHLNSIQHDL
jgi:hypothetical protein